MLYNYDDVIYQRWHNTLAFTSLSLSLGSNCTYLIDYLCWWHC